MELDLYVEQIFPINCKGRDYRGKEVFTEPIKVEVKVFSSPGSDMISSSVRGCPYNTGSHGQRCKASHPTVDKVGDSVDCPYSFNIPYALEKK